MRCGETRCLEVIGSTLYNLAEMVYEAGVKFVCGLTNSVLSTIQTAVNKIVNAFQAFVTWAIEFIESTISSLVNGMIDGLQQLGNAFCGQMLMTCNAAASDYNSTGAVSQEQMNKIATAVMGSFFITLLALGSVIIAALVILNVVTNVFSFLVGMVLSTLVTFIVVEVFMSTIEYLQGDSNPTDNFSTFLSSLITSQGGDLNDNYLSAAVDTIIGVFDILSVGILKVSNNAYLAFPMALASSICGLVIAIYADTMASGFGGLLLSVLGLELSAYGLWVSLKGLLTTSVDSNTKTAYGFSVLVSLAGTGKGISDVFKSVRGLNDGN